MLLALLREFRLDLAGAHCLGQHASRSVILRRIDPEHNYLRVRAQRVVNPVLGQEFPQGFVLLLEPLDASGERCDGPDAPAMCMF